MTIPALQAMKRDGQKVVGVVAWDFQIAQIADRVGVEIVSVKFRGSPPAGMRQGTPVKVTGLVASDWDLEGRHGIAFKAARIELLNGQGPKGGAA